MTFGIIAAGEGSRLGREGVAVAKPMVEICGETMIDRLLRIFSYHNPRRVVVIVNEQSAELRRHLEDRRRQCGLPHTIVVRSTPSSLHSFHELAKHIEGDRFCVTTVDTIFDEKEFASFVKAFSKSDTDGCMAVTRFVDDEKPLYVSADSALRITGFHDSPTPDSPFVSGGIYGLTRPALALVERCVRGGVSRMRNFQRHLVAQGLWLTAHPFGKIIDVDHASDISRAEAFLSESLPLLGILRAKTFSPNREASDELIFGEVAQVLRRMGHPVESLTEEEFETRGHRGGKPAAIFHTTRSPRVLQWIGEMEQAGVLAINPAMSVARCGRLSMTRLLQTAGVPIPPSREITCATAAKGLAYPLWLKRADGHTRCADDVVYVAGEAEARAALGRFESRGVGQVVASGHVRGDLVKFYGVRDGRFFHHFYPHPSNSKFGHEAVNGAARGIPFSEDSLRAIAERAAGAMGLDVYGGDAVVGPDGSILIIDMNDWPSFSPCRSQAAEAIARLIHQRSTTKRI